MELAPGLHRIGDDLVAAYLVVTPEGATLVDAALPGYRTELRATLTGLGLTEKNIDGIVLTHGDSDHIGFAEALRAEHGTPVYIHVGDADRARGLAKAPKTPTPALRLLPTLQFAFTAVRRGMRPRHLKEVRTVVDGDRLDLPGSPAVIGLPGHSPGSIAVHVPAVGALMVGDALTTRHVMTGVSGPQPAPFTDEPDLARTSLGRLRGIEADWILPGHGTPYTGGTDSLLAALGVPTD